jgi:hypothetical protein
MARPAASAVLALIIAVSVAPTSPSEASATARSGSLGGELNATYLACQTMVSNTGSDGCGPAALIAVGALSNGVSTRSSARPFESKFEAQASQACRQGALAESIAFGRLIGAQGSKPSVPSFDNAANTPHPALSCYFDLPRRGAATARLTVAFSATPSDDGQTSCTDFAPEACMELGGRMWSGRLLPQSTNSAGVAGIEGTIHTADGWRTELAILLTVPSIARPMTDGFGSMIRSIARKLVAGPAPSQLSGSNSRTSGAPPGEGTDYNSTLAASSQHDPRLRGSSAGPPLPFPSADSVMTTIARNGRRLGFAVFEIDVSRADANYLRLREWSPSGETICRGYWEQVSAPDLASCLRLAK